MCRTFGVSSRIVEMGRGFVVCTVPATKMILSTWFYDWHTINFISKIWFSTQTSDPKDAKSAHTLHQIVQWVSAWFRSNLSAVSTLIRSQERNLWFCCCCCCCCFTCVYKANEISRQISVESSSAKRKNSRKAKSIFASNGSIENYIVPQCRQ